MWALPAMCLPLGVSCAAIYPAGIMSYSVCNGVHKHRGSQASTDNDQKQVQHEGQQQAPLNTHNDPSCEQLTADIIVSNKQQGSAQPAAGLPDDTTAGPDSDTASPRRSLARTTALSAYLLGLLTRFTLPSVRGAHLSVEHSSGLRRAHTGAAALTARFTVYWVAVRAFVRCCRRARHHVQQWTPCCWWHQQEES